MAMFLLCSRDNRFLVILLIKFVLLILCENDLLTKGQTTVAANGNIKIKGPFLQLSTPTTRLIITKPHLPHYLTCEATTDATYQNEETAYYYTWYRNDNVLDLYSGRRNDFYVYVNGTLSLPPNERAGGVYRCKINANSTALLSKSITVVYPVLKRIPAPVNATGYVGLSLTLSCPVLSVPPANVTWLYGNVSLSKIFEDNRYLLLANGSLVLRALMANDGGKYKCSAHNQFAAKSHRQYLWTLAVLSRPSTGQRSAQLVPYLQNVTQYIPSNADLKLLCYGLTDGGSIEWWYQRTLNAALTKLSNHSNEFYIEHASVEEHEGYYTCSLSNDKQRFHVIVTVPPNILEELQSYGTLISASTSLSCRATGNPRPVVSWYHNGAPLSSSNTRFVSGNDLNIHSFDPDEEGIYQCFARNLAGEVYSAGEVRFRNRGDETVRKNPLQNIRCFAHSFNTINVTFDSQVAESLFIVHIVQSNPHRWISFAPMKLNHTSYVVISSHLPVYRPFELITRVLFPTSEIRLGNKPQQQTILSSLRSPPVTCCTQGLLLHLVHLGNDTFIAWSLPELDNKKYFILQFSTNYTHPAPQTLLTHELRGTTQHVELSQEDVLRKLTRIEPLNRAATRDVLQRAESQYLDNEARASHLEPEREDIFSLVVPVNVTGILMEKFTRIKIRVLLITTENENLKQDFRYVDWRIIHNDTTEQMNTPFRLTTVESRMLVFHFQDNFNESCVNVCHLQIQFPIIRKEEPKCDQRTILDSQLEIRGLKPTERYRLNFFNCETNIFYGQLDVQTLPDPPGTISNQRVTRHNGLKLSWDPPKQPNGKIHHYNVLWTLGNVTHETNVMDCRVCYYKFPNISESAKINVTVRVVGETGVGAPIFIDLRNIDHETLDAEHPSSNSEVYSGIAIGLLLSIFCIFCFALVISFHRRRLKARQHGPTHLTAPSDVNFGNLSNPGIPGDSAGGLSGSTLQHDCHEMQTLIPKTGRHIEVLPERPNQYQTTQLPNGNGKILRRQEQSESEPNTSVLQLDFDSGGGGHNLSQLPLCTSTPERWGREGGAAGPAPQEAKPFFIPFKHGPPNMVAALHKHSSSTTGSPVSPPSTLPLGAAALSCGNGNGGRSARRNSSLSSSSAGSNSSGSGSASRKQFHTNFPKHSKSNDGICLLAEEESAATLTPTSETDVTEAALTHDFNAAAIATEIPSVKPTATYNQAASADTATSAIMPTSKSSTASQVQAKNNSSKAKATPSSREARNKSTNLMQRLPRAHLSNETSIVPAIGPAAAATTSTAAARHWPTNSNTTNQAAATAAATATTTTTANKLNRLPTVGPNG